MSYQILITVVLLIMTSFTTQGQSLISLDLADYPAPKDQSVYWKEIYNGETIRAGYYHIKANAKDDQIPHDFDEVYWIESGRSKIHIGEKDFDIKKGDVIYVQAKQIHYFHQITEDLNILVLFSKGPYDTNEKIDQIDNIAQLTSKKNNTENVWNDFLKKKSMTFGLYLLPQATGGDTPLTHEFDEINFVVEGSGTFKAGEQEMTVRPGSLFFVKKGTPHFFKTKSGINTFILFETKSISGN